MGLVYPASVRLAALSLSQRTARLMCSVPGRVLRDEALRC